LVLFFRKEQVSSFSEEKEAKRLLFVEHGVPKSGTWPESDVKSAASPTPARVSKNLSMIKFGVSHMAQTHFGAGKYCAQ
jgi:hypothetical protein